MRRVLSVSAAFVLSTIFFSALVFGQAQLPQPVGFVNDFAGLLSAEERVSLENLLKNFEKETSNEISVVIANSLQGLDRFTYSQELFTKWGVGKESKNNGVLFLIGPVEGMPFPEHADYFVNVGKGLEGALPDSMTGSILRHEFVPDFKAGRYGQSISKTVSAIISATKGEYKAESDSYGEEGDMGGLWNILIPFGFMLISYFTSFLARSKSWWLGGVIGGVGGVAIGFLFLSGLMILLPVVGLGALGFLFDYTVSKNYQERLKSGKPTDFWHSGGGFWFGGGGGFGGFGGGISGGGGAGGRI